MSRKRGEYVTCGRPITHRSLMSGWVSLTAGFSAPIAVAALAFSRYLGTLIPAVSGAPWAETTLNLGVTEVAVRIGPGQAVAMLLIVAVAGLHSFDAKIGGWVQAAFTAAKVLLIVLFILGGLLLGDGNWEPATQGDGLGHIFTLRSPRPQ